MYSQEKRREKTLYERLFRESLIPFLLMSIIPNATVICVYLVVHKKSGFQELFSRDVPNFWRDAWKAATIKDLEAWLIVLAHIAWSASSLILLGGEKYYGPATRTGFRPEYVKSGFKYYVLTLLAMFILLVFPGPLSGWYVYKKMAAISGILFVFGFAFCSFLFVKGNLFPSPGEYGTSGNPIFDFYWGLELYPRVGRRFDLKQWTNSRFGVMAWQLIVLICWKAQIEHSGWNWAMAATSILQSFYLAKFFWWEDGYMQTIDIQVDRAGFYICWGCICFMPMFFTLTSLYMVENAPQISPLLFSAIVIWGVSMTALNYWADYQRQITRATNGQCKIWGQPAKIIRAKYTIDKKEGQNILLASGFWGLARHINYVFELNVALSFGLPALFQHIIPYTYIIFLLILLIHRVFRDEAKCQKKYGNYWDEYCKIAKYRLIPGIF